MVSRAIALVLAVAIALSVGCSKATPTTTSATLPTPAPQASPVSETTPTPEATPSLTSLSPTELRPTENLEVGQVVLAFPPAGIPAAAMLVAVQGGLFESSGLQVAMAPVPNTQLALDALQQGFAHLAVLPLVDVARAAGSSKPLVAIGAVSGSNPYNVVVSERVAQGKGLTVSSRVRQRLAMLKGLRIGVSPQPLAQGTISATLEAAGLNPRQDVELVLLSDEEQVAALEKGDVDAILATHPYLEQVLVKGKVALLLNLSRGEVGTLEPFPWLVLATSKEFSILAPQTLIAAVRALWSGQGNIRRDPTRSQEVLQIAFGQTLPEPILEESVRIYFPAVPTNPLITPQAYSTVMRLSQGPAVPYLQVVDNQFTNALIRH